MEALERFFPLFCSHRIKDHEPINFNSIIPEDKLTDYSKIWKESMMWVQKECKLIVIKNSQLCWPAQSCLTCWSFSSLWQQGPLVVKSTVQMKVSLRIHSFLAYWLRSKCLVCCLHIDLWSWMGARFWNPFHCWSVQVLRIVTAHGPYFY